MRILRVVLFVSWVASDTHAFVPSRLVSRRDLVKVHLSQEEPEKKNDIKHCIPLEEIGLDDLPKVGG